MTAILVFFCLYLPLLPRLNENMLLNFEFNKNEATKANLQGNKRKLKRRSFWNKVYTAVRKYARQFPLGSYHNISHW